MEILTGCPARLLTDPKNECSGPITDHNTRGARRTYQCAIGNAICQNLINKGDELIHPIEPPRQEP